MNTNSDPQLSRPIYVSRLFARLLISVCVVITALLLVQTPAFAGTSTCTATKDGNFSDPQIWMCVGGDTYPNIDDNVVIDGKTVTMDVGANVYELTLNNATIKGGNTLNVSIKANISNSTVRGDTTDAIFSVSLGIPVTVNGTWIIDNRVVNMGGHVTCNGCTIQLATESVRYTFSNGSKLAADSSSNVYGTGSLVFDMGGFNSTSGAGQATISGSFNVPSVKIRSGIVSFASGNTIDLNEVELSGGVLENKGTLIRLINVMDASGGTVRGNSKDEQALAVGSATLNLSGGVTFSKIKVTCVGGEINLAQNTTVLMDAAEFDLICNMKLNDGSFDGTGFVQSAAVIQKAGGKGSFRVRQGVKYESRGLGTDVVSGTLQIESSGTQYSVFNIGNGATLELKGAEITLTSDASVQGFGTLKVTGGKTRVEGKYLLEGPTEVLGGVLDLSGTEGATTFKKLTINGGELRGSDDLKVTEEMIFVGGLLAGEGISQTLTIDSSAKLKYGGTTADAAIRNRKFTNKGEVSCPFSLCSLLLSDGAWFENMEKATFIAGNGRIGGNNGDLWNSGLFTKTATNSTFQISQLITFTNEAEVSVNGGTLGIGGGFKQEANGLLILRNANLQGPNNKELFFNGGQLGGSGEIVGDLYNNAALLYVGIDIGTLRIRGDYQQGPEGKLKMQVGGKTPGTEHDQLLIDGTAILSGTLTVQAENGYSPATNDALILIDAGGIDPTQRFAPVTNGFTSHQPAYDQRRMVLLAFPKITLSDSAGFEGAYGTPNWNFRVSLDRAVTVPVRVDFAVTPGTATVISDFLNISGTVTIQPNSQEAFFQIPVIGDTVVEPDETFSANISNPINGVIERAQGTGLIRNDDAQAQIGSGGGQLSSNFGLAMSFPPGATATDLTVSGYLTGTAPTLLAASFDGVVAVAFEILAVDGDDNRVDSFSQPFDLNFTYEDAQIAGINEADLVLSIWDAATQQWVDLTEAVFDASSNSVSVSLTTPGLFAIRAGLPNKIYLPLVS